MATGNEKEGDRVPERRRVTIAVPEVRGRDGSSRAAHILPLCLGWKATVQTRYAKHRSGVLRVVEVILLLSMITFLKRAPETSGHVAFLLAVTCLVLVTVVIIYLAHLLPLHHPRHCPHGLPSLRHCHRLPSILETVHDGVSSLVLLPAAILLLLLPAPSPSTAAAAVLTIVVVLLLAVQCAEDLLRALQPSQVSREDQGQEMRQVQQVTPPPGSHARPSQRYTPNTSRGRGSARRWSKNRKSPSSPLLPLSQSFRTHSGSPVLNNSRSSRHSSSSRPSSLPHPSSHNPLPYPGSRVSYKEHAAPRSSRRGSVTHSGISPPLSTYSFVTAVPSPSSPVLSSPKTSPHLSTCSGVPLSSQSSHTFELQSPHASNVPSSIVLARPRTSSRIPPQGAVPFASPSSPPPLPQTSVTPLSRDPTSPRMISLTQIQEEALDEEHIIESWHDDPPSPIYSPSPCPSPTHTYTLESLLPPPSSTTPSLTPDVVVYTNITPPCDPTFNVTPFPSDHLPVSASTHEPTAHTTTPSPLTNTPSRANLDATQPTTTAIYAMPIDACPAPDHSPIYENVSPLTINTSTTLPVITNNSVSSHHSPIYDTVVPEITANTTSANPCNSARNSSSSSDSFHSHVPISYL
ncbi:uncharacterized protein LOC126982958 [Eriocheir sinensis]|uniref:uncharacterized protein LOC126982958 n=1 Tax=Eriocheir sinensis TaxID=95602 RepID=UPI0021C6D0AB|nr:uncharacterized protein LOC126982958 [Eriocheir sinensis]XP_050691258.1 uncharacterized protein LOC126982958 [Eriocheir sinensis]XP_050691259.1 uncharacterized protein LOC126982958 [Eriocheir sinensis]